MAKSEPKRAQSSKNTAQILIRLDPDLRDAFTLSCEGQDRTASQVLRDFIREYVAKHGQQRLL